MKLSELYQERMAANPELTRKMLVDAVGSATVYAVQHDVPRKFRKGTLQKLAELWKCSTGDIQACFAEIDDPRRKTSKEPSVMETVDKLEQMVAPDPEEEIHLYNVKRPTEPEPPAKVPIKRTDGSKEYKKHLTDILMNILLQLHPGEGSLTEVYASFGYAVAKELGDDGNV